MQHFRKLDNFPFRVPFFIHENTPREQLIQNNHRHGSRPKEFNKNKDASKNKGPLQAKNACPITNVISVRFDDPYDHINPMENTH